MRLAGVYDLERAYLDGDSTEPFEIGEQRIRSFVRRRPSGEADRQNGFIPLRCVPGMNLAKQASLGGEVCLAKAFQWNPNDVTEVQIVMPPLRHMHIEQFLEWRRCPGYIVDVLQR
jgi:hypothetical protein